MESLLNLGEIRVKAKESRVTSGLSQYSAAEKLGVSQGAITGAENTTGGKFLRLQIRMIEELGGVEVEGPYYKISSKK